MNKITGTITVAVAGIALTLGACSKSEDSAATAGKGADKASPVTKEKVAAQSPVSIASLALQIDVDEDSIVSDNTKTAHFPSATIYSSPTLFIIGANEMFWEKDLAAQKAEIEKSPGNKFKKFTKEESADGGFHLEFELLSMMDETLYGFHLRSTVNGKEFDCSSNADTPEGMAKGVAMCKTLRAK